MTRVQSLGLSRWCGEGASALDIVSKIMQYETNYLKLPRFEYGIYKIMWISKNGMVRGQSIRV